jgi:hypothetical protein
MVNGTNNSKAKKEFQVDIPFLPLGNWALCSKRTTVYATSAKSATSKAILREVAQHYDKNLVGHYTGVALGLMRNTRGLADYAREVPGKTMRPAALEKTVETYHALGDFTKRVGTLVTSPLPYTLAVEAKKTLDGRTIHYKRYATFEQGKQPLVRYEDKTALVHNRDIDGKLDLFDEAVSFAESVESALQNQPGISCKRTLLNLLVSKEPIPASMPSTASP